MLVINEGFNSLLERKITDTCERNESLYDSKRISFKRKGVIGNREGEKKKEGQEREIREYQKIAIITTNIIHLSEFYSTALIK